MKLYIDSTDNKKVIIKFDESEYVNEVDSPRDQDVFGFILACMEKENLTQKDISEIEVNTGPGSFTGTRIGVTIANALALALNIKVNGKDFVEPEYSTAPSTTPPMHPNQN